VLCLAYEDDEVVRREHVEEIVRQRAATELVWLPGSHLGMYEHPDRVAAEVVRFISGLES